MAESSTLAAGGHPVLVGEPGRGRAYFHKMAVYAAMARGSEFAEIGLRPVPNRAERRRQLRECHGTTQWRCLEQSAGDYLDR
jgi:hypothetical protein